MNLAIAAVALVVLLIFWGDDVLTTLNEVTRGPRLTHAPADASGLVRQDPDELAAEAGASLEAYALARMISSEEGSQDPTTQAAIAWATLNTAKRGGKGVAALLLRAKNPRNNGRFGTQKDLDPESDNLKGSDRYASTRTDPYERDLKIAQGCISGEIPDLTAGATNYDRSAGEANPERVAASRVSSGLELVAVDGAAAGLRFWRPA